MEVPHEAGPPNRILTTSGYFLPFALCLSLSFALGRCLSLGFFLSFPFCGHLFLVTSLFLYPFHNKMWIRYCLRSSLQEESTSWDGYSTVVFFFSNRKKQKNELFFRGILAQKTVPCTCFPSIALAIRDGGEESRTCLCH